MASNIPPFAARVTRNGVSEIRIYKITVDAGRGGNYTVTDLGLDGKGPGQDVFTSNKEDTYKRVLTGVANNLLKPDLQNSLLTTVGDQADKHRVTYLKTEAASHLEDYKDVPGIKNVETQPQNPTPNPGSEPPPQNPNANPLIPQESIDKYSEDFPLNEDRSKNFKKNGFPKELSYPEVLKDNIYQQDYIEFTVKTYKARVFIVKELKKAERYGSEKQKGKAFTQSTIRLPIQGGISDSNNVNWGGEPLDAIRQGLGFASLTMQETADPDQAFRSMADQVTKLVTDKDSNKGLQNFLHALMVQKAIGSDNNFISRAFGAILNPNMELLFQNVELRPFSFRFDLTPRNADEAKTVRQIIRVFKQSMAPRQGVADLFLTTPMVYDIKYINGNDKKGKTHKSIGKIKTCALKSFIVNYTPNNQYMTYNDDAATMTSYSLDMTFQELEPVYFDDYDEFADDVIGY